MLETALRSTGSPTDSIGAHFLAGHLGFGLLSVSYLPTCSELHTNDRKAGFVQAISGKVLAPGWLKCFQAAWFIGFLGGGLVYYAICLISPPPGRPYVRELFGNEHSQVIDGVADSGTDMASDPEKSRIASSLKDV